MTILLKEIHFKAYSAATTTTSRDRIGTDQSPQLQPQRQQRPPQQHRDPGCPTS